MEYAKLIDNRPVYAPNPIRHNGLWYGNPPADVYLAEGYKPVAYTDQPEPQGDGWWEATWTETTEAIVQGWEWHEETDSGAAQLPVVSESDNGKFLRVVGGEWAAATVTSAETSSF